MRTYIIAISLATASLLAAACGSKTASTQLCRNGSNQIATCGSSLRYKKDVARFTGGLIIVNRLRPISFTWKDHPERDLGLAAEDVAKVEPRLVTHNAKGELEGVKYDRLTAVLVNAIKQQQDQIRQQQAQIARQQRAINRLNRLVGHGKASRKSTALTLS